MRTFSSVRVERFIVGGFLLLILTGTFLLWLSNLFFIRPISFLDALFTITSGACVTGLAVVDTGKDLSLTSQWILLIVIQLGGLGVMTATTALPLLFRHKIGIHRRLLFAGGLGMDTLEGAVRLLIRIILYTSLIEGIGALILFAAFLQKFSIPRAAYLSVFHSISAFCNAGFSPFSDNLESFSRSLAVPGAIMGLIVLGGIGFPVMVECRIHFRNRETNFSPYTKLVVLMTLLLIFGGAGLLCLSDWKSGLSGFPSFWKFWNALFQSITARTAGFDTVPMAHFSALGLGTIVLLMIVGASPASTGGGVKTTTVGVLLACAWSELCGGEETDLWGRQIPSGTVKRAIALVIFYLGTLFLATMLLTFLEPYSLGALAFEAVSAMGTVGLSTGITPHLSPAGKIILILLMFWGRVGIITFMYSLLGRREPGRVSYPQTNIPIG